MDMKIRKSVIAGTWYPGNAGALKNMMERYFKDVRQKPVKENIVGLISPHAGYMYSGKTAAHGYAQLAGHFYDTVVLLSPLHQWPVGRFAIRDCDAYQTPLGNVPLDHGFIAKLRKQTDVDLIQDENEHSIEIQLPMLQHVMKDMRIVPVMIGEWDMDQCDAFIDALTQVSKGSRVLIIASSDLYHIENYQLVKEKDEAVIRAVESFDLMRIREALSGPDCTVCGRVPIMIMLSVAGRLGATHVKILHHTTSGDITGDRRAGQYTVGYLSAAVY